MPYPCCCKGCPLFSDDFERTSIGSDWSVQSGTWSINNGVLRADGSGVHVIRWLKPSIFNEEWILKFKMRLSNGHGGVNLFHNSTYIRFNTGFMGDGEVQLFSGYECFAPIDFQTWHDIVIYLDRPVDGDRHYHVKVDGQWVISSDNGPPVASGTPEPELRFVGSFSNSFAEFDDVAQLDLDWFGDTDPDCPRKNIACWPVNVGKTLPDVIEATVAGVVNNPPPDECTDCDQWNATYSLDRVSSPSVLRDEHAINPGFNYQGVWELEGDFGCDAALAQLLLINDGSCEWEFSFFDDSGTSGGHLQLWRNVLGGGVECEYEDFTTRDSVKVCPGDDPVLIHDTFGAFRYTCDRNDLEPRNNCDSDVTLRIPA